MSDLDLDQEKITLSEEEAKIMKEVAEVEKVIRIKNRIRDVQEKRDLLAALKSKLIDSLAERISEEVYTNMEV